MTPSEFKAWFDGFTESMEGRPTDKQWRRIKKRVSEINEYAITEQHFRRYYYEPFRPYWASYGGSTISNTAVQGKIRELCQNNSSNDIQGLLTNAGRAEFAASTA